MLIGVSDIVLKSAAKILPRRNIAYRGHRDIDRKQQKYDAIFHKSGQSDRRCSIPYYTNFIASTNAFENNSLFKKHRHFKARASIHPVKVGRRANLQQSID